MTEREIFDAAIDQPDAAARDAFLDRACGADRGLRDRVESLLREHGRLGSFLERPVVGPAETAPADAPTDPCDAPPDPGSVVGPYKLLEKVGEGGMGTVWAAEQAHPIRRRVAVKLVKPGMDSRTVLARFEAERQALALMDHPNIARVIDAGATADGRPYFAMELVKGVPITRFCDERRLTPRERLELFVPVCQAVQHAHQKGVIHRDLKPSNVLVELQDGRPVPKVIDFGVAKATEQKLTERTLFTQYGTLVGTLEYMSPEQAEMSAPGVDTRSDVFSLGVLLYELLTGSTPLSHKRLREAAFGEILRMIREEEAPKPSARLSDSGEALASISARRHMEPAKLTRLVRGELDWIVMKCLEKDRNRRYETANAFAADVQCYLSDEAVQACPPSAGYRLRKFVRRNKGPVLAGAALAALLVLGTVGTSVGLAWALQAERTATLAADAEARERREAETQRDKAVAAHKEAVAEQHRANDEAAIAKAINDFLQNDLLAEAAPDRNARNKKVTVEEVLGRAAAGITGKFENQPRIEAAIRMTIGRTYYSLSDYPAARPHLERAWEIRRRVLGEGHNDTLASMNSLAGLYRAQGHYPKAEPLYVEALEMCRRVLGEEHPDTLVAMNSLAGMYYAQGLYAKAEPLYAKTLEVRRRVLGEDHTDTLVSMNNLAGLYRSQGHHAKAEPLFVTTLAVRRRVWGEEHPDTLTSMSNLAWLYHAQGQLAKAEPLWLTTLEVRRRVLGEDHSDTVTSMNNLAVLYYSQGLYAKAEPLYVKTLDVRRRVAGQEHPDTLTCMSNLAVLYRDQGQYAKAEPLYAKTLEVRRRVLGQEHPDTLVSMNNLAGLYQDRGQYAKAELLHVETLELKRRVLGEEHPSTLVSMNNLASLYRDQGHYPKAEALFVRTLDVRRRVLGEEHQHTLISLNELATLNQAQGRFAEGERIGREALEKARKPKGGMSAQTADALTSVGENLLKQHKYAEAEPLLRECLKIREQKHPDDWRTFHTRSLLGGSLLGQGKHAAAEPPLMAGYEGMKEREARLSVPSRIRLAEALGRLVQLYDTWGKKGQADEWRKQQQLEARREADKKPEKPDEK